MSRPRLLVIQHLNHDSLHELGGPLVDAGFELMTWCTFLNDVPPPGADRVDAIVSMGGDDSAYDQTLPWIAAEKRLLADALARDVGILGICFGAQSLAIAAGGRGFKAPKDEVGWTRVDYLPEAEDDRLGQYLVRSPDVYQWHYDTFSVPEGAVVLGKTDTMIEAYRLGRRAWGLQFHLEVNPATVHHWSSIYPAEVSAKHIDAAAIDADTAKYWRTYREVAWDVAAEFAAAALED